MIRTEEILENQMIDLIDEVYADSGLGRWFGKGGVGSSSGGGWDRYNSSGKKAGKCGDAKKGSSYSACLGKKYVDRLRSKGGKKAIANWVKRKKSAQNKAGRGEKGSGGKGKAPVKVSYKEQLCEIFVVNHKEQLKKDLVQFLTQQFQKDHLKAIHGGPSITEYKQIWWGWYHKCPGWLSSWIIFTKLDRKGHIKIARGTSRGIQLLKNSGLPVVGRVAAGQPILSEEHIQTRVQVEQSLFKPAADYLLKVKGSSMRDIGIQDGDLLAVHASKEARSGQVIVARINQEVTVKRLKRKNKEIWLEAENPDFSNISINGERDEFAIEGIAVGIIRNGKIS